MASPPRGPVTRPLQICMGGDTMLGRIVDKGLSFDTKRKTLVWGDVLSWIADKKLRARQEGGAFILAGNLECAITNETRENPKAFNFRLLKENADVLSIPQFDFVSLANNHILDYWRQGLLDTIETLSDLGIAHAGAGTLPDAKRAAVMRKAVDISPQPQGAPPPPVAFVSLSDHYHQWAATHNEPGINFVDPENFKKEDIQEQISLARSALGPDHAAGLVIAFLHWGPNWRWEPEESLQRLGHCLIDSGADAVFGHSAHHVRGVEAYKGKPIMYSAGSLIDDYAIDEDYRNDLGCIYNLCVESGHMRLEGKPCRITHKL
ncbi:poly-gamma-glutamate synthesis protein [Dunaliella salina]|uniref:Poly-gamma-glutamate synthesis protein n=1 Tax=Dunaliella salina TaxID=3046 RepID=A0ABQ7GZN6_DUNSA|nr:poly-gamma-glutamate synthesis protein [Dunaliella salina]|eukprot:KAF5840073.1 poly-gamma-glutamate synthesis protein [Dunaliella salina]